MTDSTWGLHSFFISIWWREDWLKNTFTSTGYFKAFALLALELVRIEGMMDGATFREILEGNLFVFQRFETRTEVHLPAGQ
jgi:hypothetical protein